MFIQNGIVYASNPKPQIKVLSVRPLDNYRLWLRFTTGDVKVFDFKHLLDEPAFKSLKDQTLFNKVYVDYGCTVWNDGEIDIAPEYLFENGTNVKEKKSS